MMNLELGARIRSLRLAASMTQEQLASELGISAQAISKWESGVNLPDITLLPTISVIFGVSIDELFEMTDERRLDRIENRIESVRRFRKEEFAETERFLTDCRTKREVGDRATLLLAMLYNKRAEEYRALAAPLAREALTRLPGKKDAHNAVFDAEGGAYQDWNCINHHETIAFYQSVVERHPEDVRNYFWLLDLLIADGRTEEAKVYVERMRAVEYSYHYELYRGNIAKAECDLPAALDWWRKMTEHSPERWVVWASYADAMAKLGRYDEAIRYYEKAMPMRPKPRFIDCEEAVAHICEIRGDYEGAIGMQRRILEITREDWCPDGEAIDAVLREIRRLEEQSGR